MGQLDPLVGDQPFRALRFKARLMKLSVDPQAGLVQRCVRQRVDRAGMNLTPPTSPKPAESSESIALILFKSCRIVGCCFQEEDTHIQKDGEKKDTEVC